MDVKRHISFFILFICNIFCFSQVTSETELLIKSRNYYDDLRIFSVNVLEKRKPPVSEDTTISRFRCLIDNQNKSRLFLPSKEDNGMFLQGEKEYSVDLNNDHFIYTKNSERKYTAYNKRYQYYPFVEIDNFFDKISNKSLSLRETDTEYILSNDSYLCEFRKSDYSVKRFVKFGYDKRYKSSWYEETNFSECVENDTLAENYINKAVEIVSSGDNEEYWTERKHVTPISFDRSILGNKNLRIVNNDGESFDNKIIFLDFFYSSCIPCYKSHPLVNKLYENRDSNFIVIGIDPVLSDTLHINQFLERFNIKHPVLIGQDAFQISQIPGVVKGYPTFLVIDVDGKVLEYRNGHSEKFLRDIEKKYLNKKLP